MTKFEDISNRRNNLKNNLILQLRTRLLDSRQRDAAIGSLVFNATAFASCTIGATAESEKKVQ